MGRRIWGAVPLLLGLGCQDVEAPQPLRVEITDPYARPGAWYRGNFHVHTSHSDGAYDGEGLASLYAREGYGVLAITDHNQYGDQDGGVLPRFQNDSLLHDWNGDGELHAEHVFGSGVEAYVRDWSRPPPSWAVDRWVQPSFGDGAPRPVLLSGAEASYHDLHIGLVGCPSGWIEPPHTSLEGVARTHAAGGFVYLAHPAVWNRTPQRLAERLQLRDFDALEIINGLWLSRHGGFDARPLWDELLASGYRLWGLANDDAHTSEGSEDSVPFTAFNMLRTDDPTARGFLAALHAGAFYGSTGVLFDRLALQDRRVVVSAPGATRLRFIGRKGSALLEVEGPSASYEIGGLEGYVRVEAEAPPATAGGPPRGAWSQPFFIRILDAGSR
jgi:hypothetical protein